MDFDPVLVSASSSPRSSADRMQFGSTFLAESPQPLDGVAVHRNSEKVLLGVKPVSMIK
jgi:hypothetical protein